MESAPDLVVCLSCGKFHPLSPRPECPRCDDLGWASWSSLSERERLWYSAVSASWEAWPRRAHPPAAGPRLDGSLT